MRNVAIIASAQNRFTLLGTILNRAFSLTLGGSPRVFYFPPASDYLKRLYKSQRGIVLTVLDDTNCDDPLSLVRDIREVGPRDVIIVSGYNPAPSEYFSPLGPTCVVRDTLTGVANRLPGTVCCLLGIPLPKELSVHDLRLQSRGHWRRSFEVSTKFTVNGCDVWVSGYSRKTILSILLQARRKGTFWTSVDTFTNVLGISRSGVFAAMSRLRDILAEQTEGKGRCWIENSRDEGYRLVW